GEMQIRGEQMAHAVVGREAQSLRDKIRGFFEAAFLAIQISAPEERGGVGGAREGGGSVPDAREGPQKSPGGLVAAGARMTAPDGCNCLHFLRLGQNSTEVF